MRPSDKCKSLNEDLADSTVISKQEVEEAVAEVDEDVEEVEENELDVLTQKAADEKQTVCKKLFWLGKRLDARRQWIS